MAWKPPSTWMISPVVAGNRSESSADARARDRLGGPSRPSRAARARPTRLRTARSRGCSSPRSCGSGRPRRGSRGCPRRRGRGRGTARSTRTRPWRHPSSRRRATRRDCCRSRGRRSMPPLLISGRHATASALSEYAETCSATATSSHGAVRKPPPRHDSGAKPIACSTPSSWPPTRAASASRSRRVGSRRARRPRARSGAAAPPAG